MLGGLRVLELVGRDIWGASAAAHCGRILADLGADVVKAEPPDGDPVRRVPPYLGERADEDRGLLWIALNANKRGVVLDHADVRRRDALVRDADVVVQASVFADIAHEEHMRLGPNLLGRSIVGARFRNIWPCADGHVSFAIQGGPIGRHTGRMLASWMAERGFVAPRFRGTDWQSFDNRTLSQADVDSLESEVGGFLATLRKREFFAGVIARNMLGYPVADARDIYDDEQLKARAFWQDVTIDGATLAFPGGFALFDGDRPQVRRRPPRLGEHNSEVLGR